MAEHVSLVKYLKECEDSARRIGHDFVFARANAIAEARKKLQDPDRVKVVRCRDCCFWKPDNAEEGADSGVCMNGQSPAGTTTMTWFCADGVRGE